MQASWPSSGGRARAPARRSAPWLRTEREHLDRFDDLVAERRGVRPTALQPLWHVAGFALGAATALMGERAAMACTVAVEEVIDEHYAASSRPAGRRRGRSCASTIERFRADELEHRDEALARGAEAARRAMKCPERRGQGGLAAGDLALHPDLIPPLAAGGASRPSRQPEDRKEDA